MRNFKARRAVLLILATGGLCLPLAKGQDGAPASSEPKTVSSDELGLGNYSHFPFTISAGVRGGYDDNVTTSNAFRQKSWFTNGNVALTYDFGSPRTQLSLGAGAGVTYFWDHIRNVGINNNDYDINSYISFSLTHKATPRLTLSTVDYLTYQTEPDFTLAQGLNRRGGNFFYTNDKGTVAYLWTPRFSTATSYTLGALRYDDSAVGFFEDRWENTFGNEFRFLVWPTTSLVAEYRFQIVTYENIMRDSMTHFALGGFDYAFNPRLNASLRAGAQFRSYDNGPAQGGGVDRTSPYFEGTVNYAVGKETSVSWTTRYSIEESDVALNADRKTFRTGLSAKHNITSRVSGTLGMYYENDDYQGASVSGMVISPGFNEQAFDAALTVRYAVNRFFGVEAGYNHTEVWSDMFLREYSRNRYWAGLNVVF
jgi:hypothetical protein